MNCTKTWTGKLDGKSVSGAFWYDTSLAPTDQSPLNTEGNYLGNTNQWLNTSIHLGKKEFDFSSIEAIGGKLSSVEDIRIFDSRNDPTIFKKQSFTMTEQLTAGIRGSDFLTQTLTISLETFDKPIVEGTSLIQEYKWQPNGFLLQGVAVFTFESTIGDQTRNASAYVRLSDFTMNIRPSPVPEPSPIYLLLATLTLGLRRLSIWRPALL